jgi:hypothetical protein
VLGWHFFSSMSQLYYIIVNRPSLLSRENIVWVFPTYGKDRTFFKTVFLI